MTRNQSLFQFFSQRGLISIQYLTITCFGGTRCYCGCVFVGVVVLMLVVALVVAIMVHSLVSCHMHKLQHDFMVRVRDLLRHPSFNAQGKVLFTDF